MDLLLFVVRGVSVVTDALRKSGHKVRPEANNFVVDALFSTITNANFDVESILGRVDRGLVLRNNLIEEARSLGVSLPAVDELTWNGSREDYAEKAATVGVLRETDADSRSLKELVVYGLKGMAAYLEHAMRLDHDDESIHEFMQHALATIATSKPAVNELIDLVMKTGEFGVKTMALLDTANTSRYGQPEMTRVNIGVRNRPGILISGHDLRDLEDLLEQTKDQGVDVYTPSEMLPGHYYPDFKKYEHFVGYYGNAWWKQREEFSTFNGPILFTTNCIVPPLPNANYKDRVFTANSTGYPGFKHIPTGPDGRKDFSEIIALAKQCQPPTEIEHGEILGGFAHNQVVALADYTEIARRLPKYTVNLTAGCEKNLYNKQGLCDINDIPRVLDAGQCNDSYSLAVIALKLKEIFQLADVNDLPITYNIAWYEQKAVIVLLALLSLGVKNIHLGPTLPAFLSPGVAKVLVENFGIGGIGEVESDLELFGLGA